MCRSIKLLHHFEPPASEEEVRASALQFVRKLTGMNKPSKANEAAFQAAVDEIAHVTFHLFEHLEVKGPPRSRAAEEEKARERGQKREAQLRARYAAPAARERRVTR
jgi:hypothetical protein